MYSAIALLWLSGFGILCSVIGMFCASINAELPTEEELAKMTPRKSSRMTTMSPSSFSGLSTRQSTCRRSCSPSLCRFVLFKDTVIAGKLYAVSGRSCERNAHRAFTEYSTAYTQTPTKSITEVGKTGPATVVIQGLGSA